MNKREFNLWYEALSWAMETGPGKKCPSTKTKYCPCDLLHWYAELEWWRFALYLDDPFLKSHP